MEEKVFHGIEELKAFLNEMPKDVTIKVTVEVRTDGEEESTESE